MPAKSGHQAKKHNRRSIRLKGYNYAQSGLYFITLCCQHRAHLFGEIRQDEMILNEAGHVVDACWKAIPEHFPHAVLHAYVVMPDHMHGIIELNEGVNNSFPKNVGAENLPPTTVTVVTVECPDWMNDDSPPRMNDGVSPAENIPPPPLPTNDRAKGISPRQSPSRTIGSIIRGFKIGVTKWMRQHTNVHDVWQRNYYEHIIRNELSYHAISEYIRNNPAKWNEFRRFKPMESTGKA